MPLQDARERCLKVVQRASFRERVRESRRFRTLPNDGWLKREDETTCAVDLDVFLDRLCIEIDGAVLDVLTATGRMDFIRIDEHEVALPRDVLPSGTFKLALASNDHSHIELHMEVGREPVRAVFPTKDLGTRHWINVS
mgnify:CR=1 FL=1